MTKIWEDKIRKTEKEVHRNLFTKHKDGRRSPKPDITGYLLEDCMLADFMIWLRNTYPQLRKFVFHIENEGDSSSSYARMKGAQSLAKGKLAGVFDILSVYKGKMIWIELKLPRSNDVLSDLSEDQKELKKIWEDSCIEIHVVNCFDDFKRIVEQRILKLL